LPDGTTYQNTGLRAKRPGSHEAIAFRHAASIREKQRPMQVAVASSGSRAVRSSPGSTVQWQRQRQISAGVTVIETTALSCGLAQITSRSTRSQQAYEDIVAPAAREQLILRHDMQGIRIPLDYRRAPHAFNSARRNRLSDKNSVSVRAQSIVDPQQDCS
jgi:hypothetical protein